MALVKFFIDFPNFSIFTAFRFSESFLVAQRLERIGNELRIANDDKRAINTKTCHLLFVKLGVSQLISDALISFVQLELSVVGIAVTYYSVSSVLQIFKMHSLNVPSQQKILGFDGDEFTFNNLNRIMKIIAKTARKVVDIFNCFSLLRKQLNFTPDFDSNSIFTSASSRYAFLSTTRLDVSDNFDSSEVFLRSPWKNEKVFELKILVLFCVTQWRVDRVVQFWS